MIEERDIAPVSSQLEGVVAMDAVFDRDWVKKLDGFRVKTGANKMTLAEALIRDTVSDLAPRSTVFIIAHRLSTLAICDRIMVIRDGVLEGFDEPKALEDSNPFYQEALRLSGMR